MDVGFGWVEYTFRGPGQLRNAQARPYVESGDSVSRLAFDEDFFSSLVEYGGGLLALEDPAGFVEDLLADADSDLTVHLWTNTNSDFSGIWGYRGTGEFDIGTNALVLLDALINCGF